MRRWRVVFIGTLVLAAASAAAVFLLMPGRGSTASPPATTSQPSPETNVGYCIEDTQSGNPVTHVVVPGDESLQAGPCPAGWPP